MVGLFIYVAFLSTDAAQRSSQLLPTTFARTRRRSPMCYNTELPEKTPDALRELFWRALPARFALLIFGSTGALEMLVAARGILIPDRAAPILQKLRSGPASGTICSSFGSQHLHLGSI
jgi:hypothetical protein